MSAQEDDRPVQVKCPECKELVKIPKGDAERDMSARCSRGHIIPLVKAL